ncbi:hypothetical protein TNCV_1027881 [Trichonephila clavipes]|nr:hypothetical protein TNCV_1027881 [Trichonephila clavipes]
MLLQGCGIDSKKRNVTRQSGAGRLRATIFSYSPSKQNRECYATAKDSCSWQQDEGCPAKQYVIGFKREGGLYAHRPMVGIPLTPCHRAARRRWAAEHRDWEQHDLLFTDESRFCDTRRVLVWRDRGHSK